MGGHRERLNLLSDMCSATMMHKVSTSGQLILEQYYVSGKQSYTALMHT